MTRRIWRNRLCSEHSSTISLSSARVVAPPPQPPLSQDHASVGVMYMLGPDILKLMPSAYTVAQELERYKMEVLKVSKRT